MPTETDYFSWLVECGHTDRGCVRKINEDHLLSCHTQGVYCVADGVGGGTEGRYASASVVEALDEAFTGYEGARKAGTLDQRRERVERAMNLVSRNLFEHMMESDMYCASTALVMLCDPDEPNRVCLLHAGDSRAYRLRDGRLEQLTEDHSPAGQWNPEALAELPPQHHHKITRAVGISPSVAMQRTEARLADGDLVLLCSDGLYNMVSPDDLTTLLARHRDAINADAAKALIEAAREGGGRDNITAIVVRYDEPGERTGLDEDADIVECDDPDRTESEVTLEVPVKVPDRIEAPNIERPILAQPQPKIAAPSTIALVALLLLAAAGWIYLQAPFRPMHAMHQSSPTGVLAHQDTGALPTGIGFGPVGD